MIGLTEELRIQAMNLPEKAFLVSLCKLDTAMRAARMA